jgi:hypothetical protein
MAKLKCPMAHLMESHVRTDGLRPSVLKKCYGQKQTVKNNTRKPLGVLFNIRLLIFLELFVHALTNAEATKMGKQF